MSKVKVFGQAWGEEFECGYFEYKQGYVVFYEVHDEKGYKEILILSSGHFQVIEIEESVE